MISRTGHTGAVKSPMAPTYSRMRIDSTSGVHAAQRITAISAAPDQMEHRLQARRGDGTVALEPIQQHIGAREAAAVQRVGELQEDDADDRQRHQFGDAAHRRAEMLRPSTSALISTISATIHSVPSAFMARPRRCEAARQRRAVGIAGLGAASGSLPRRAAAASCRLGGSDAAGARPGSRSLDQSRGSCVPALRSASM